MKVSIILPNLNTPLKYLGVRLETILNQSFTDWECIIIDGFSNNGSWEYLNERIKSDARFQIYQKPRRGIYNAWNEGIRLGQGKYIYIATSDDTMSESFLQRMVVELDENPECSLAHCCLQIIDDSGNLKENDSWDNYYPTQYFQEIIKKKHIRLSPHDGVLHSGLKTLYTSVTQLLIRSELFQKIGLFLEDKGSMADFEWGMRAGLVSNVLHIPEYLATWRKYDGQASSDKIQNQAVTYQKYRHLIDCAFESLDKKGLLQNDSFKKKLKYIYWKNEFDIVRKTKWTKGSKLFSYVHYLVYRPTLVLELVYNKIWEQPHFHNVSYVKGLIADLKLEKHLIVINK